MSRFLKQYIDFIFSDYNDENFVFYLNDEYLFVTLNFGNKVEELSNKIYELKKLPSFRSTSKENISKYRSAISFFNEENKKDTLSEDDRDSIKIVLIILNYKIFLIKNNLANKNNKNSATIRKLFIEYIEKKYSKIKIIEDKYFYNEKNEIRIIKSLNDFINTNNEISNKIEIIEINNLFYRGHSDFTYNLIPSIYRDNNIDNEHRMFRDILIRNPEEFLNTRSTFEKLTIMQHYGLPTRLLDVTKNPLVALYFAVENANKENNPSEVLFLKPNSNDIKYYDSDTICILSNLSKCERTLHIKDRFEFNNNYDDGSRLLHLIKEDKPHFINNIDPSDFNRTIIVKPINNNNRIKRQSGYFFIFGFNEIIKNPSKLDCFLNLRDKKFRIFIDPNKRKIILDELDKININRESLFPEIENGTNYIKNKYNFTQHHP